MWPLIFSFCLWLTKIKLAFGKYINAVTIILNAIFIHILTFSYQYASISTGLKPFKIKIKSIIGYTLSILIVLIHLNKKHNIKYNETFKLFGKILLPSLVMIIVVFLMKMVMPVNYDSKLSCVLYIGVISVVGAIPYLFITFRQGVLYNVFGKEYLSKLINKLTFNKIKLS